MHAKELGNDQIIRESYCRCIELLQAQRKPDLNRIGFFYYRIARTYIHTPEEMILHYRKALEMITRNESTVITRSRIYAGLSRCHMNLGNLNKAEECILTSMQITIDAHPERDNEILLMSRLQVLKRLYEEMGKTEEVMECQRRYEAAQEAYFEEYPNRRKFRNRNE